MRRYGTLLVLDEVQTGFHRTGKFLAAHQYGVDADMVVLAKAMSGGIVPASAVLMTRRNLRSVYGSLDGPSIHTSTFSENGLAMRVGLASLDALQSESCERALRQWAGNYAGSIRKSLGIRNGQGGSGTRMFSGIVFRAP